MNRIITESQITEFKRYLHNDEKSESTITKYLHDLRVFAAYVNGKRINKEQTLDYKAYLEQRYAITSANSMLAAMNTYLRYMGWQDCCVKQFKLQRKPYSSEKKELTKGEYMRLLQAASKKGKQRLNLLIQTICGTGIRVSELKYITVEALHAGEAIVSSKGKTRVILIVSALRKKLLQFAKGKGIHRGSVFVNRQGRPMNRSTVWREMKSLCEQASVSPKKVFPHNLRHLFARTYYNMEKDIAKLADILGHSNINTTRIYVLTTGLEHRSKMERMRLII